MKIKQILAFSLLAFSSAFVLNSCGDKDETNPAPGIDFIAEGGSVTGDITMDGDKTFTIVFQVTDNSKVATVEVKSVVDGRISPQLDTTLNVASAKIKLTRKSLARIADEVWTITATDDKGVSTSKSLKISTTTAAGGDPLTIFDKDNGGAPLYIYNVRGPKPGAYDLKDMLPLTVTDPYVEKDLLDSCADGEIPTWPGRITAGKGNGTMFKKITSYAFTDITKTGQLDAAWNGAGVAVKTFFAATGDIYIAKLRGTNEKVLIHFIEVKKTPGDNEDYYKFQFKKKV